MKVLSEMKIGVKLSLGFASQLLLLLALVAAAMLGINSLRETIVYANKLKNEQLEPLYLAREALDQTGIAARNAYVFVSDADAKNELNIVDEQKAIYLQQLQLLEPRLADRAGFAAVREGLLQMAEELKRPRRYRDSGAMEAYRDFLVNECSPLRRKIVANINQLIDQISAESTTAGDTAENAAKQALLFISLLAGLALLIAVVIAFFITRSLLRQLGGEPAYAMGIAQRIAHGDLAVDVVTRSHDQSSLLYAIKMMRDSLSRIVAQVRQGTDSIERACSEISSGNADLSGRTERQASSLEETASAMEQITSAVRQSADNAIQANQLAGSASSIALKGGQMMGDVVATMEDIHHSSVKIVDIISVIDGIAFQTNILALNAAVEAARAGEGGRGFAVVASEVRTLAQRSAAAAKEIKELISASVAKVESGSGLVKGAGETMGELVGSVQNVSKVIAEITASSREQSTGIEQVNDAISHMDEVTQQNSALVEQSAAAAEALTAQAQSLARLVSTFKVAPDALALR
ncbi:chemotaxis protein [Herbaspirillum seropedicae]|uniref:Methyl-accepting chemotaxis transducer transmembrane protein n=1 Tax=Herbaspirillum seropedicae (strain SmR1) TaxID=757424 RepID=D8IQW0_HERSS|nr:methyl-accepting chemotaxis protein [Herbaspirillum seropedicae]ADJ63221.1 methyl-accepting chemotaxis transducer transmembrane protein [Herbaspirillum seropedicae SmR1]AKN65268.1 chemotaxis protein [Herbaspirillum seropedicae]NQE31507.1 chemotaxis protein [Herbaspirillum seropedicae]UMU21231.1 chemotaxis protein [Herbaspirillum seropedicae]